MAKMRRILLLFLFASIPIICLENEMKIVLEKYVWECLWCQESMYWPRHVTISLCYTIRKFSPTIFSTICATKKFCLFVIVTGNLIRSRKHTDECHILYIYWHFKTFRDLCTDHENWTLRKVHQKITHKRNMTHQNWHKF